MKTFSDAFKRSAGPVLVFGEAIDPGLRRSPARSTFVVGVAIALGCLAVGVAGVRLVRDALHKTVKRVD